MTMNIITNELIASIKAMGGVEAALVTSRNGINFAMMVPPALHPDTIAVISSALKNMADLMKGHSNRAVIECEHNKLVIVNVSSKSLFTILVNNNANLGPLFTEMNTTASKVEELLDA